MGPAPLDERFSQTRENLHIVAAHVVARARQQATGRFGLRVTPGGFGTTELGDELVRVRIAGGLLVRESGSATGASSAALAVDGATLADLAAFVGVDLSRELSVGRDTPPLGDVTSPLSVDVRSAMAIGEWYSLTARALDETVARAGHGAEPTMVQLWPEHFDVGVDLAARPGVRVNLGGSPGDGYHDAPYLYVGPRTSDRPGDPAFWNAPFGALLPHDEVVRADDPVAIAVAFFQSGLRTLAG